MFFWGISSARTKDSRTPPKHTNDSKDLLKPKSISFHLQLSAFLQLLDLAMQVRLLKRWASVSPGDVGMGLRVRSFFGNHILRQTADPFVHEIMSFANVQS